MSDSLVRHPGIVVRPSPWGLGVYTDRFIFEGDVVEECHWVGVPDADIAQNPMNDYVFSLDREDMPGEGEWVAVVLGFGMIYNHAEEPNLLHLHDRDRGVFTYYAARDIEPGEQLCVSYGKQWWKDRSLKPG